MTDENPNTPAPSAPATVRDSVVAAFEKHGAPTENALAVPDDIKDLVKPEGASADAPAPDKPKPAPTADGRARDEQGKFTKRADTPAPKPITDPDTSAKPTAPVQTGSDA